MEITKHHIYQDSSSLPKNLNFLKPATKYLNSLLFPVLLSCSSLLIPLLLDLVQLISCHVHKNYMFLLFNGILVLLKVFRSLGSSDEENYIHEQSTMMSHEEMTKEKQLLESSEIKQVIVVEEKVAVEEKEIHCIEDKSMVLTSVEVEQNNALITNDLEGEQGNQRKNIGEEEEEEEDEIGLLSDEELNKKFDDFIRRVKEGIKNEAQHVNSFLISQ